MLENVLNFFQISSGLDVELFRITFVVSIVISLLITYRRHNAPIGIIVPGTFILLLGFPIKLLIVLSISALIYFSSILLQKYIFPHTIFAAKERLFLLVFLSVLYSFISYFLLNVSLEVFTAGAIGIVVPAMIADNFTKAHRRKALESFLITFGASLLFFIITKLLALEFVSPQDKHFLDLLYPAEQVLSTGSVFAMYLLFAIATVGNFVLYRTKKMHSTGLLLGAYLGILVFQPLQIVFVTFVIGTAYLVMLAIYKFTMIFGYRIFVLATLVVSVIYAATERIAYIWSDGHFHAFIGLHFAGIIVCSILVSEMVQHGYKKVAIGSISMTAVLALSLFVIQSVSTATHTGFTIASLIDKTYITSAEAKEEQRVKFIKKSPQALIKHTVTYGENLTDISQRYCHANRVAEITAQNHITQPDIIHIGTVLTFTCASR